MAFSRIVRIGDGSTNIFSMNFTLGYLSEDDITCQVDGAFDGLGDPIYRSITFLGDNLVQVGGATPALNAEVVFERTTTKTELAVNFSDGDTMDEDNLDLATRQAILLVHEVLDGRFSAFNTNVDMGGFLMVNMGAPVDPTDSANKAYVDARYATGLGNAQTATTQAGIATTQAGISTAQAVISTTQAGLSAAARADAQTALASANAVLVATQAAVTTVTASIASTQAIAATVVTDRNTVAADKAIVAADKAAVANDKATVNTDKGLVAADRVTVQADKVIAALASDSAVAARVATEAIEDNMLALYAQFNEKYLGEKTAAPSVDNTGGALVAGALYFDTTEGSMFVYTGSVWTAAYVSGMGVALLANNGADYTASTFRTNLDLYSTAQVDTALALKADASATTTALAGKAAVSHTHIAAHITDFSTATDLRISGAVGVTVQPYDAQLSSLIRQNSQSANYTLVATDAGKHLYHPTSDTTPRTWTIPANSAVPYAVGSAITFVNDTGAGAISIAINADTLLMADSGDTGTRTLAANGLATALKTAATRWIISGAGLT